MDYKIENLIKSETDSLGDFFSNVYNGLISYGTSKFFEWKTFNNPYGVGVLKVARKDTEIVSSASLTMKRLILSGSEMSCVEIGDTYTRADHQRKGLFVELISSLKNESIPLDIKWIYGTPNANSLPGYLKKCDFYKADFLKVYSFILPLEFSNVLNSSSPYQRLFLKILDCLVTPIILINLKFRSMGILVKKVEKFDKDIDVLYENKLSKFDFVFKRNSLWLNWRFDENPFPYQKYLILKNNKVVGVCIYRIDQSGSEAVLADYFCTQENVTSLNKGIAKTALMLKKNGVKKIKAWGDLSDYMVKSFWKLCFIKRSHVEVIGYLNLQSNSIKNVHFTISDSDNI